MVAHARRRGRPVATHACRHGHPCTPPPYVSAEAEEERKRGRGREWSRDGCARLRGRGKRWSARLREVVRKRARISRRIYTTNLLPGLDRPGGLTASVN